MAIIDTTGIARPELVHGGIDTLNSRFQLRNLTSRTGATENGQPLDVSLNRIRGAFGDSEVANKLAWVIDTPDGRAVLVLDGPMARWSVEHPDDVHASWLVLGEQPPVMGWIVQAL